MTADLNHAIALHRAGRLAEAEAIYRHLLAREPEHPEALHLLGLIACQSGALKSAEDLIGRAAAHVPGNAEYQLNLGEVQRRQNRLPEAMATFRRAAALAPENPYAHYNLAVALAASGDSAGAIEAYRRAIGLRPDFPEALNNLGLLLHQAGADEAAAGHLQKALALRPAHAEAEVNLGLALWNLQRHGEALAAFTRAAHIRPDFPPAHANRALALRKLGARHEALAAFQKAAELNPVSADIHRDMAMALLEVGRVDPAIAAARRAVELAPDRADTRHALGVALAAAARNDPRKLSEAVAAYHQALALQPDTPEWQFELADLQDITPPTAPDSYVKTLFDEYALRFEHHLVDELGYRVPGDLLAAVLQMWPRRPAAGGRRPDSPTDIGGTPTPPLDIGGTPMPPLDILDLGCGTGLCGERFHPHARSITGIDLAPDMIARAQNRRGPDGKPFYDRLVTAPILPALRQFEGAFDLILAADVFIYVGALHEIFPAAARALRSGGLLAFSIEHAEGSGFTLHHRFAHAPAYIRAQAAAAGLTVLLEERATLRNDVPPGWLIVLGK